MQEWRLELEMSEFFSVFEYYFVQVWRYFKISASTVRVSLMFPAFLSFRIAFAPSQHKIFPTNPCFPYLPSPSLLTFPFPSLPFLSHPFPFKETNADHHHP